MKNYKDVAESVFQRSEEIIAQNKRRRREMMKNIGAAAGCLAVAGAVGIGVWKNAGSPGLQVIDDNANAIQSAGQFANDGIDHSGESDTVSVTDHVAEGDGIIGVIPDLDPPDYPTLDDITDSVGVTPASTTDSHVSSVDTPASSADGSSIPVSDDNLFIPAYTIEEAGRYIVVIEDSISRPIPDSVPANGTLLFTDALKRAMADCGITDENVDIRYRVVLNYYDNGQPVDINSSAIREGEWNRLCGYNLPCEFEEICDRECGITNYHFCMIVTREQLESFPPCDSYGCTIGLYGERYSMQYNDNASAPVQPAQSQQPVESQ